MYVNTYRFLLTRLMVIVFVFTMGFGSLAHAQSLSTSPSRPTWDQSFGQGELTLTTGAILGLGLLSIYGEQWLGPRGASMGAPAAGSNDLRFSHWSNPHFNPQQQWWGGVPDLTGYIVPAMGLSYYLGGSLIGGNQGYYGAYPHEAIAFTQGLSWAMFTTTFLKHLVGRERPYVTRAKQGEFDVNEVQMKSSERLLSFPSGHSTAIAASSFFMAADLSDALVYGPLAKSSTMNKLLLGRVLPYTGATALTWMVMYSRVKDQRHWLSDTITGAAIGAFCALLSYHMHFDRRGQPRTLLNEQKQQVKVTFMPQQ